MKFCKHCRQAVPMNNTNEVIFGLAHHPEPHHVVSRGYTRVQSQDKPNPLRHNEHRVKENRQCFSEPFIQVLTNSMNTKN